MATKDDEQSSGKDFRGKFAKGNEFWRVRTTVGRKRALTDKDDLLKAAIEYFEYCDANPIYRSEAIKGGDMAGTIIDIPIQRPYTMEGVCGMIGVSRHTFMASENRAEEEKDSDFLNVFKCIREIIDRQKLEGAIAGLYKENIVARLIGLGDKTDITTNGKDIPKNVIMFGGKEVEF